jgi:hypothetical protein
VSPPWSSALAGSLERDRQEFLVAFVELRARLRETTPSDFPGGDGERDEALEQTERDYIAVVEAGAEAARLETRLASADREATPREVDAASIVIRQMRELVAAVADHLPIQ